MHLLSILSNRPTIRIRINEEFGEPFETYLGIIQGDCLSAVLFIFYLAECFAENNENTAARKYDLTDNNDLDFYVDPFYTDDTSFAGTNQQGKTRFKQIEEKLLKQMEKKNLTANHTKTERDEVRLPPPPPTPDPSYETLIKHKNYKIIWSDFDYLINYHSVIKNNNPDWKKCKLLGSLLGTKQDVERRKNACNI